MHRTMQIRIKKGHRLYPFCRDMCLASARLYNRGNYLIRQYATARERMDKGMELTQNQKEACELIDRATKGTKYAPKGKWLNYGRIDYILKVTEDAAYRGMPSQANQQTLKMVIRNYTSFFESLKEYKRAPERFKGHPKMPGYRKKGSLVTAVLTNQICTVKDGHYLKFPGTKERLNLGRDTEGKRLKEVRIKAHAESYVIDVVFQTDEPVAVSCGNELAHMDERELKMKLKKEELCRYRVASIDPGLGNFCAVVNNFGEKPFIIRGGLIKSRNNYYNKELARLKSEAEKCNGRRRTRRISGLHDRRNRIMKDLMHKASRKIADWAEENRVELLILGHNIFQKQDIRIGKKNNQQFVQVPFQTFAGMLEYKLRERGIAFVMTEEAYTSKADFLALDPLPAYEKGKESPVMSGERVYRGLYRHGNGSCSNADINGAANIMRKVFPNVKEWDKGIVDVPYAVSVA